MRLDFFYRRTEGSEIELTVATDSLELWESLSSETRENLTAIAVALFDKPHPEDREDIMLGIPLRNRAGKYAIRMEADGEGMVRGEPVLGDWWDVGRDPESYYKTREGIGVFSVKERE